MGEKTSSITIRLTDEMRAKLDSAQSSLPYKVSITTIIERGITLAVDEIARMSKSLEASS